MSHEQNRFHADKLSIGKGEVKHFVPVNGFRDRLGNRIFRSRNLTYIDRSHNQVQAALLISREGQQFVSSNPGILNNIDRGLVVLEDWRSKGISEKKVELTDGRSLERWKDGSQSRVDKLTVAGKKYIVKTQSSKVYSQPFISEMLQTQSLATDLREQLREMNIAMPTFLFASGQVSCVDFVEGIEALEEDLLPIVGRLHNLVKNYIDDQRKKGNKLWNGVFIDLLKFYPTTQIRANNFVKTEEGKLVWIDPFFFR